MILISEPIAYGQDGMLGLIEVGNGWTLLVNRYRTGNTPMPLPVAPGGGYVWTDKEAALSELARPTSATIAACGPYWEETSIA